MQINVNDYLIIEGPKKPLLVKVTGELPDSSWRAIISSKQAAYDSVSTVDFQLEDVVANLGDSPFPGEAYKTSVEPWINHETISTWGDIHYYIDIAEEDKEKLHKALRKVEKLLRKYDLLEYFPVELEVKYPKGIKEGTYKHSKDLEKNTDLLVLRPHSFDDNLKFIIYRCIGSHIWRRHLDSSLKAKWITLYHNHLEMMKFSIDLIETITNDYISSNMEVKDFIKDLESDSEEQLAFKSFIDYLKKVHKIKKEDIKYLIRTENSLNKFFPNSDLEVSMFNSCITKNASKSSENFFVDYLVTYLQQEPINDETKSLVKESLRVKLTTEE